MMPRAAIVDYGVGNIFSMSTALVRAGFEVELTADPAKLREADAIVLPGVGNFAAAAANIAPLKPAILDALRGGKPFLGSCLGMQVMFDSSEEGPGDGLGLVKGRVVRFGAGVKVPHMGWNTLRKVKETPLLEGIGEGDYFYFVHSYYPAPDDPAATAAVTDYGGEFASVVSTGSVHGCQFHPEKSGKSGARLLRNFLGTVKR